MCSFCVFLCLNLCSPYTYNVQVSSAYFFVVGVIQKPSITKHRQFEKDKIS